MRIAIFSMTPLFENQVMGGSQQILRDVACHLGSLNHQITICATKRWDTTKPFMWHRNVLVKPIFDFKQPYPDPYATKPYSIASAISDLSNLITNCDRLYLHDSAFLFPYVYRNIPTVGSLPDVVYSETLLGSFIFAGCHLIVPSEYTREVYLNTVGRFFPELRSRLVVIHNGFDFSLFRQTEPSTIFKYIPRNIWKHKHVILHPHRPEPSKGLSVTIQIVESLVKTHHIDDLIAFVPLWIETEKNENLKEYYKNMQNLIRRKNLDKYFYFHQWLPRDVMPQYFSLGSIMFSFGDYVETFGNAVYEAIGCGTPVIVSNRGPHRTTLPRQFAEKVEPDDILNTATKVAYILKKGIRFSDTQLVGFREMFSIDKMANGYSEKILGAKVLSHMKYIPEVLTPAKLLTLAPWIVKTRSGRLLNEFNAQQPVNTTFAVIISSLNRRFTIQEFLNRAPNLSINSILQYLRNGWIVPVAK